MDSKYLCEFTAKACRYIKCKEDLSKKDNKLLERYVNEVLSYSPNEVHNIIITEWEWKHNNKTDILIDMNIWTEYGLEGAIFLDERIVLENERVHSILSEKTSAGLKKRVKVFDHLRLACYEWCANGDKCHNHCMKQGKLMDDLIKMNTNSGIIVD